MKFSQAKYLNEIQSGDFLNWNLVHKLFQMKFSQANIWKWNSVKEIFWIEIQSENFSNWIQYIKLFQMNSVRPNIWNEIQSEIFWTEIQYITFPNENSVRANIWKWKFSQEIFELKFVHKLFQMEIQSGNYSKWNSVRRFF